MSHVTFLRTAMSLGFLPCCLLATLSHETPVTAKGDSPGSRSSRQQRFQGENTVFALSFKKNSPWTCLKSQWLLLNFLVGSSLGHPA